MTLLNYCPRCRTKLIPIVYGRLDPEYMELMSQGKIILSLVSEKKYNSFCPLCEESYVDFTESPAEVDTEDTNNI